MECCGTTYFIIILRAVVSLVSSFTINHITLQEIRTLNVCASPLPASQARTAPRACSALRGSACQAASRTRTALSTSAAFRGSACVSICAFFSIGFPVTQIGKLRYLPKKICTSKIFKKVRVFQNMIASPHKDFLFGNS
jgi:hypothetical protein